MPMSNESVKNLAEKIAKSKSIIREALDRYDNKMALAWTGGKDSTTTLHLLREVCNGQVTIPVLNIDTSVKFPEIYEFRDRLAKEWQLDLHIERNEEALKALKIAANKEECCLKLKTEVIAGALEKYGWKALITGMRWDEQPDRVQEIYFSPRSNPDHMRVNPILHFTEMDVWQYIKENQIPYCILYRQGYRSLGCEPCTRPGAMGGPERDGRDKQKEEIMNRLRRMGYF
jgi:phosphoadenosine phosphosulfate reductase